MPKNRIAKDRLPKLQLAAALMGTTILAGLPQVALAQSGPAGAPAAEAAAAPIQSIAVVGSQRLEPVTIRSFFMLRIGQPYTQQGADQALKDLFATELFSDVQIRNEGGNVTIAL